MIDSSVARALASSLYSLMQPFRARGRGQVLRSNPLILTYCCSFSSLIPFIMYRGLGDFGEEWSKENMEYVGIICVCCHCMLTPFGSRPTLCLFSLLLLMQVEEAFVALDISSVLVSLGFDFPGSLSTAWAVFLNSSVVVCPPPTIFPSAVKDIPSPFPRLTFASLVLNYFFLPATT